MSPSAHGVYAETHGPRTRNSRSSHCFYVPATRAISKRARSVPVTRAIRWQTPLARLVVRHAELPGRQEPECSTVPSIRGELDGASAQSNIEHTPSAFQRIPPPRTDDVLRGASDGPCTPCRSWRGPGSLEILGSVLRTSHDSSRSTALIDDVTDIGNTAQQNRLAAGTNAIFSELAKAREPGCGPSAACRTIGSQGPKPLSQGTSATPSELSEPIEPRCGPSATCGVSERQRPSADMAPPAGCNSPTTKCEPGDMDTSQTLHQEVDKWQPFTQWIRTRSGGCCTNTPDTTALALGAHTTPPAECDPDDRDYGYGTRNHDVRLDERPSLEPNQGRSPPQEHEQLYNSVVNAEHAG